MKKLYTSFFVLLGLIWLASPVTFAQSDTYIKTPNAAISGHNNKKLPNVTPQQCQTACSQERSFSCKSFDYDKENYACDLSDKRASDVGGLKRDYAGDQYDHYSLSPRFTSNPRPSPDSSSDGVTLYQHCNYDGYSISLPAGSFDLSSLQSKGMKNDDISSIKVSPGYRVNVYKDVGYRGTKRVFEGNVSCLTSYGMNDELSSVHVSSNSPRPTITTPPPTGPSIIPDSSIAHTGKLACVCTENSCGSGIVSGKAGDIFIKQSLFHAREFFTTHSRTGWTCAVPNKTSSSSGATGCYCKGYCGNGGRGADPKTLVLGVSQSSIDKYYGGGEKDNGTGWICGNIRN